MRQGTEIVVNVTNEGDLDTTVHWHGLRLENRYDGCRGSGVAAPGSAVIRTRPLGHSGVPGSGDRARVRERLGAVLAGRPRDEFVVSTKVGRLLPHGYGNSAARGVLAKPSWGAACHPSGAACAGLERE